MIKFFISRLSNKYLGLCFLIIIYIFFICSFFYNYAKFAITYEISGGRLGDQLIYYCIAKNLSIKHNIPFFYRPFKYSDKLMLSSLDNQLNEKDLQKYEIVKIGSEVPHILNQSNKENILYLVSFQHWHTSSKDPKWYGVNSTKEFRRLLKKLILPKVPIQTIKLPQNTIIVAVHVRTGEGYDSVILTANHTEKFPKDEFYIKQINKIKNHYKNKKIYFHIFTDAINPELLLKKYKSIFSDPFLTFGIRKEKESWKSNILNDLFSMANCDCLIRPKSGFSVISQVIGNHNIIFYPGGEIFNY
ncbi:MAG: hypothetical protein WDZ41_03615 [Candidatus Babeliales bacterium]